MRNLTLLIPGLFGPKAAFTTEYIPQLDSLAFILGRARRRALPDEAFYRLAGRLLDLEPDPAGEIPAAAVTRLMDAAEPPQGYWMRTDPVHLSPDRDGLILIDSSQFVLNQHDSLAVAAEVGLVLREYGWNLEAPHSHRWYIHFDDKPDITTTDIAAAAGQDINHLLPVGTDAKQFHKLMNEIQMQLHGSDVNREREAKGEVAVNSVWFWGLGELPDVLERRWSIVYADNEFIKGLAVLSATPYRSVPDEITVILDNIPEKTELLVVLDDCHAPAQYQDLEQWRHVLLKLEKDWLAGLPEALGTGLLDEVSIVTPGSAFHLNRMALKKFWRRPKTLGFFTAAR